jgi:hypothetical protein
VVLLVQSEGEVQAIWHVFAATSQPALHAVGQLFASGVDATQ